VFAGFNREVRNSLRLMGLRISYAVAAVQITAEQWGAVVRDNIDLVLSARGTGRLRSRSNVTIGNDQTTGGASDYELVVGRASDRMVTLRADANRATLFNGVTGISISAVQGITLSSNGGVVTGDDGLTVTNAGFQVGRNLTTLALTFNALVVDRAPTPLTFTGAPALPTATTNLSGGAISLVGGAGASSSAGAANGGHVYMLGGQGFGTGVRGLVHLGYNGTTIGRVTVRNTILGLNGYTSSAADPTTTELATAGDYGIHKNTTSGTVFLAFNDAGTIRKVALA